MGHKKLIRFEAIRQFGNVLEYPKEMPGNWPGFFGNQNPITLELACGKGEYAVGLGRMYPDRNFLGMDLKGNRIWRGAKTALDEGLKNVGFVRSHIDKITDYFAPGEVAEIWITFPDPQLRLSRAKKRLTHPRFLRLYQQVMGTNGLVHLKTDSPDLYRFTLTVIQLFKLELLDHSDDVYKRAVVAPELQIKTYYESLDIAQSSRIHYICFRLNQALPVEQDEMLKQLISEQAAEQSPAE